jgi:hypothetical protein
VDLNDGFLVVTLGVLSAPLAGGLSLCISQAHTAVVNMHILNVLEGDGRDKSRRFPRLADFAVKLVNLLKRQTLGLVDHGPDEEDADEAASTPNKEDLSTKIGVSRAVIDHVRGSISNRKVKKPVAYEELECAL